MRSLLTRCDDANMIEIPVEIETPDHHYYHVRAISFDLVPFVVLLNFNLVASLETPRLRFVVVFLTCSLHFSQQEKLLLMKN